MIEDKKVYFHLRKRRYKCLACGATFYERLLFVERYQRRTTSLNQQALTYASENSFTMAAKMCGITTSSLLRIFDKSKTTSTIRANTKFGKELKSLITFLLKNHK